MLMLHLISTASLLQHLRTHLPATWGCSMWEGRFCGCCMIGDTPFLIPTSLCPSYASELCLEMIQPAMPSPFLPNTALPAPTRYCFIPFLMCIISSVNPLGFAKSSGNVYICDTLHIYLCRWIFVYMHIHVCVCTCIVSMMCWPHHLVISCV